MRWFSSRDSKEHKTDPFTAEVVTVAKEEDSIVRLTQEALAQIPQIAAQQAERLEKFNRAHAADVSSYRFSCKRHGDFLAVFITRGPDRAYEGENWFKSNKTVSAINIGSSSHVSLNNGSSPAADYIGSFTSTRDNGKIKPYFWTDNDFTPRRRMFIQPNDCQVRVNSWVGGGGGAHFGGGGAGVLFLDNSRPEEVALTNIMVPGIARGAVDDEIEFGGTGVGLSIPAGLGEVVYNKILSSCAGYLPAKKAA